MWKPANLYPSLCLLIFTTVCMIQVNAQNHDNSLSQTHSEKFISFDSDTNEIKDLLKLIRYSVFEEESARNFKEWWGNFIKEWSETPKRKWSIKVTNEIRKKLNLHKITRNVTRAYWKHSDKPVTHDHVKNMLTLFGISHGVEAGISVSAFPWIGLAIYQGISSLTIVTQGFGMMVVIIPGLDPICYIVMGSYLGWSFLDNVRILGKRILPRFLGPHLFTNTRIRIQKGLQIIMGQISWRQLFNFKKKLRQHPLKILERDFLEQIEWSKPYDLFIKKEEQREYVQFVRRETGELLVELQIKNYRLENPHGVISESQTSRAFLELVKISNQAMSSSEAHNIRHFFNLFPWLARHTLREALDFSAKTPWEAGSRTLFDPPFRSRFNYWGQFLDWLTQVEIPRNPSELNYVEFFEQKHGWTQIKFSDRAIDIPYRSKPIAQTAAESLRHDFSPNPGSRHRFRCSELF